MTARVFRASQSLGELSKDFYGHWKDGRRARTEELMKKMPQMLFDLKVPSWKGKFSGWGGLGCGQRSSWSSSLSQHWCSSLFARSLATLKGRNDRKKRDLARREFQLLRRKTKLLKATLSPEERLQWRLRKANRKRAVLLQRLKKYELEEDPEPVHDPELITVEQHQALKKIGYKNRNYVPVGRRGVYGGVVLNMHMHWKFHETVQIDCHIFKREDVRTVAKQLAILSGGIVIDIHQATNIIMYRGRNYRQPKKQMTPPNTLTKRKALFKSKHLQALEGLDINIQNIQAELQLVRRKQQGSVAREDKNDARKLPQGAAKRVEDGKVLGSLSNDDLEDDDDDDGLFSWESDSLDEDELSDADELKHKESKVMHEEKVTKPVGWTLEGSPPPKGKKKHLTAKELILAEQELFRNRRQAEAAQNNNSTTLKKADLCDPLTTDDEDNNVEKPGNASLLDSSKDDVILNDDDEMEVASRGKGHTGIRNKKIAKFMEDFESDSEAEEEFGSDFDDLDDLDHDKTSFTAHKEPEQSDDEK
ncbi:hypothetical protein GOP47_0016382 [Adiantum capillus-veneris]|uniref:CRM domain-containing protein n=1 Tax=Adiantum capillus-veneris TaxID=13818 RepID=A0A9D4UI11_ADICA|nr:hypothetical protein GOP47_0016382 [Adiantum capillus-veneris]